MEICFLKSRALDTLKNGLPQIYDKYFTQRDNSWLADVCGENPFVKFRDVPDFELAPLDKGLGEGEILFRNCKILYKKLNFLTARQAADERFWAGLCHGVFYDYLRRRHKHDTEEKRPTAKDIKTRFFFEATSITGIFRNSLSKCWWTGRAFYDATRSNVFEKLDIIGANDISSKISYVLRYPFTANPKILNGIVKFFEHFGAKGLGTLKNTLRPAMYELNKRGGAVVLDCLTEEEIASIMIEHVEKIFSQREQPATSKKKFFISINPNDTRTVELNSRVTVVSLRDGSRHIYKADNRLKKKFSDVFNELIGKKINSTVTLRDGKYKITDIT